MPAERLQKLLAQAGVASRRAAEALILEGRVRVNGRVVSVLGSKADLHADKVEVDGKRIVAEKPAYYIVNKPREVVTTLDDPEGRDTIKGLLRGVTERVYPVGRLDYHTSGALLLTNDGAMAQALLHPTKQVPKTYVAKVRGSLDVPQLDQLRNGVDIGHGETTRKAEVFVLREEATTTWTQITITEGKNRQVHRMFEAIGSRVSRLSRLAFAGLTVEGLRPGEYRALKATELNKLKRDYLNPAKRAASEAVKQAALDAAMRDMGYAVFEGEEPSIGPRPRTQRARSVRKRNRSEREKAREQESPRDQEDGAAAKGRGEGRPERRGPRHDDAAQPRSQAGRRPSPRAGAGRGDGSSRSSSARSSSARSSSGNTARGPEITRVGTTRRARRPEPDHTDGGGAHGTSPGGNTYRARPRAETPAGPRSEAKGTRAAATTAKPVATKRRDAPTVVRRKKATATDARTGDRTTGAVVVRRRRVKRED